MASTDYAVIESIDTHRIVVVVYHDPWSSYSRSVLPRAKRKCHEAIKGMTGTLWEMVDVNYDRPHVIGNAVTVATFTRKR